MEGGREVGGREGWVSSILALNELYLDQAKREGDRNREREMGYREVEEGGSCCFRYMMIDFTK